MMNLWRAAAAALFAFVLVAATADAASQCVTKIRTRSLSGPRNASGDCQGHLAVKTRR